MKKVHKKILLTVAVFLFIVSVPIALVSAQAQALGSGYAVTSNWHGVDVPIGSEVVVTALTTDPAVAQVVLLWENPGGQILWKDTVDVAPNGDTYNGDPVYSASAAHVPEDIGDWGVHALFIDDDGQTIWDIENIVAIRSTSFNVIPEIPLIGTAGASIAMLLGFTYKMKKKPQK
jgi:hypothetical protein